MPTANHLPVLVERDDIELARVCRLGADELQQVKDKFGVDVTERFHEPLERLVQAGMLESDGEGATFTRQGLLQVDTLLPEFYDEKYQNARYT